MTSNPIPALEQAHVHLEKGVSLDALKDRRLSLNGEPERAVSLESDTHRPSSSSQARSQSGSSSDTRGSDSGSDENKSTPSSGGGRVSEDSGLGTGPSSNASSERGQNMAKRPSEPMDPISQQKLDQKKLLCTKKLDSNGDEDEPSFEEMEAEPEAISVRA